MDKAQAPLGSASNPVVVVESEELVQRPIVLPDGAVGSAEDPIVLSDDSDDDELQIDLSLDSDAADEAVEEPPQGDEGANLAPSSSDSSPGTFANFGFSGIDYGAGFRNVGFASATGDNDATMRDSDDHAHQCKGVIDFGE